MQNQFHNPTPHMFSYQSSCHHPSQNFFEVLPMQVSSLYLPSAFDHIFLFILFIHYQFCNPWQVTKIFWVFFLQFEKSIVIIDEHVTLLVFYISVFTLFNICLRMIIFTLFVDGINLRYCRCIAIHTVWNVLTMKI